MKILILEGLHGNNKGKKCQWRLKRTNLKVGNGVTLNNHDWKIITVIGEKKKRKRPNLKVYSDVSIEVLGRLTISYTPAIAKKRKKETERTLTKKVFGHSFDYIVKQIQKEKLNILHNRPYFRTVVTEVKGKPSRGENLGKIKLPCPCIWGAKGYRLPRMIIRGFVNDDYSYSVVRIDRQEDGGCNTYGHNNPSLRGLIEELNIEIIKGELHLWREVK